MTVPALPVPWIEYDGNGIVTQFYWEWKMLIDSSIDVYVDNVDVSGYTIEGNYVVFDVPPEFGAVVLIFRRTVIHQPEDYEKFRGFKANKTELTLDREFMIAQELESGGVGGANIFPSFQQDGVWVNSERGTDAFIPLWSSEDFPDPPDSQIIWGGARIAASRASANPGTQNQVIWWSQAAGGELGKSNFQYGQDALSLYTPWLNFEFPAFGTYWIRVSETIPISISGGMTFEILDKDLIPQAFNVPFDPVNSQIIIKQVSGTPPQLSLAELIVDICADDGFGAPDENWVSRQLGMLLEYSE
jgi:hypothetical protein